tara:strand:+ start:88 stop:300 length:213 start_codon:yes stop_codon:yes gene_type:complete
MVSEVLQPLSIGIAEKIIIVDLNKKLLLRLQIDESKFFILKRIVRRFFDPFWQLKNKERLVKEVKSCEAI